MTSSLLVGIKGMHCSQHQNYIMEIDYQATQKLTEPSQLFDYIRIIQNNKVVATGQLLYGHTLKV